MNLKCSYFYPQLQIICIQRLLINQIQRLVFLMGNQNATPRGKQCQKIGYGKFQIVESQGVLLARKSYQFQIMEEKQSFLSLISLMRSIQIPTIVRIEQIDEHQSIVQVDYQYFEYTLRDQIDMRIQNKLSFCESQILSLMDCILSGLIALQFKSIHFADVRPQRIFIALQSQGTPIFKLALPLLFNNRALCHQFAQSRILDKNKKMYYMSPEVLCQLENPHNTGFNLEKNDVFGLGMIILEMISLSDLNDCYEYERYIINHRQIKKKIYNSKKQYSQGLTILLENMLAENPKIRLNYGAIFQKLEQIITQNKYYPNPQQYQIYCSRRVANYENINFKASPNKKQYSHSKIKGIQLLKSSKIEKHQMDSSKKQVSFQKNPVRMSNQKIGKYQSNGVKGLKRSAMVQSQLLLDSIYMSQDAKTKWKSFNTKNSMF